MNPVYSALIQGLGDITPLARPHAVPGVQGGNVERGALDETPHLKVTATKVWPSLSVEGAHGH